MNGDPVNASPFYDRSRYVWGRRFGRKWCVRSARISRDAKLSEMIVRAWTKGGAKRLARRKLIPETWTVVSVERWR